MRYLVPFACCFLLTLQIFTFSNALRFELKTGETRCIYDEMNKDEMIIGNYEITGGSTSQVSIAVKDSKQHTFFQKLGASSGKFTFSSEVEDSFDVCFHSKGSSGTVDTHEVFLDIKPEDEVRTDGPENPENLKPLEAELKKVEYYTDSIVRDFVSMHKRADAMRDINASTHSRVLYLSLFSILCLIGLAVWQVIYLRNYFKSKKLID
ncbi:unnamed protein product [Rodentolepis nana]|uniref:GOLD domain-containing protein n=1 Tax=Rodentolepis nana TaxID=102285 RepID=A0A0R3TP58_RODNA|nr:unnamed protein product [Rodentolepis nana]